MGRTKLDLGEVGTITTIGQVSRNGKWVPAGKKRAERYRSRAYYCGYDGMRKDVAVTGPSRARAEAALKERLEQVLKGADDVTMSPGTLFVAAGETWLKQIARSDSGLSERTVDDYERTFKRCIDAEGSSLRGLTLKQANSVQRLRGFLERVAEQRGTGSAKMCRSVLSGILGLAVDNGVLDASAMGQVRTVKSQTPKESPRDLERAFTREERDAVIAFADALVSPDELLNPRTRRKRQATADLIAFMAGTGCRIEEARSLPWSEVDLTTGTCNLLGTKTKTSARTVTLPKWLLRRMKRRAEVGTEGLVFPSPAHTGKPEIPWDQSNSAIAVRKVLDDSGHGWAVPHTFRRTVATLLHEQGAPLRRISDQLGHADPSMTARIYLGKDFGSDKADLAALL